MSDHKPLIAQKGVVVEVLGPVVFVCLLREDRIVTEKPYACSIVKGKRFKSGKPVCGDIVSVQIHSETVQGKDYQGVIEGVDPRSSLVERLEPGGRRSRSLVANLNTLVVVTSACLPPLKPGLIDRYLVCAHHWGLDPLIVINKWELAVELDQLYVQLYEALGYTCLRVSARQNTGLDKLSEILTGRRSAFLGHSGVGKSSILNVLFPDVHLATGELSLQSRRGCHTTTASRLLAFDDGGFVIDTPGVREFGIVGIPSDRLSGCFPEFASFSEQCRFQPCSHTHEPGCAVRAAVESDALAQFRYQAYLKMLSEIRELEHARYHT